MTRRRRRSRKKGNDEEGEEEEEKEKQEEDDEKEKEKQEEEKTVDEKMRAAAPSPVNAVYTDVPEGTASTEVSSQPIAAQEDLQEPEDESHAAQRKSVVLLPAHELPDGAAATNGQTKVPLIDTAPQAQGNEHNHLGSSVGSRSAVQPSGELVRLFDDIPDRPSVHARPSVAALTQATGAGAGAGAPAKEGKASTNSRVCDWRPLDGLGSEVCY